MKLFFGAVLVVIALVFSFFLYATVKMAGIEDAWIEQHHLQVKGQDLVHEDIS